jgi:hypothetical protein
VEDAVTAVGIGRNGAVRFVPGVLESAELRVGRVGEVARKAVLVKRASQETEFFNQLPFLLSILAIFVAVWGVLVNIFPPAIVACAVGWR